MYVYDERMGRKLMINVEWKEPFMYEVKCVDSQPACILANARRRCQPMQGIGGKTDQEQCSWEQGFSRVSQIEILA